MLPYQEGVFDGLARSCLCLTSFIPMIRFVVTERGTETNLIIHYPKNKKKYDLSKEKVTETVRGFMQRDPDEKLLEADITHTGLRTFHVNYYKDVRGTWNREKVPILNYRKLVMEEDINMDDPRFNTKPVTKEDINKDDPRFNIIENIRNHIVNTLNEIDKFPLGKDGLVYEPEILVAENSIVKPKEEKFNIALGAAYSFIRAKVMTEESLEIMVYGGHTYLFESCGYFKTSRNTIEGRHLGHDCKLQLPMIPDGRQIPAKEDGKFQSNAIYIKHKNDSDASFGPELLKQKITIDWTCANDSDVVGVEGKVTQYDPETKRHFVKFFTEETDSEDDEIKDGQTGIVEDQWFNLKDVKWQLTDYIDADFPEFDDVQAVTPTDAMILIRHVESDDDTKMLSAVLLVSSLESKLNDTHSVTIHCRSASSIDPQVAFSPSEARNVTSIVDIVSKSQIIGLLQHTVMYEDAPALEKSVVRNPNGVVQENKTRYVDKTEDEEAYSTDAEQDVLHHGDGAIMAINDVEGKSTWVKCTVKTDEFDSRGFAYNEYLEREIEPKVKVGKPLKTPSDRMYVSADENEPEFKPMEATENAVDQYVKKAKYITVGGQKKVFDVDAKEDVVADTKPVDRKIRFQEDVTDAKVDGEATKKAKRTIIPTVVKESVRFQEDVTVAKVDGGATKKAEKIIIPTVVKESEATESIKKKPRRTLQGAANFDYSKLSEFANEYIKATKEAAGGEAKKPKIAGDDKESKDEDTIIIDD